jgi:hypothetical protein
MRDQSRERCSSYSDVGRTGAPETEVTAFLTVCFE